MVGGKIDMTILIYGIKMPRNEDELVTMRKYITVASPRVDAMLSLFGATSLT